MVSKTNSINEVFRKRIVWVTVLLLLSFSGIIVRLAFLQIVKGADFRDQADDQRTKVSKIMPVRGEIKINDKFTGQPYTVATSIEKPLVYAIPASITNPEQTAKQLAQILGLTEQEVLEKFQDKDRKYVPIKKQLSENEKKQIENLKLPGIAFDKETLRFYPEGAFMSQLLGFVGYKDDERTGLYGVEQAFNDYLTGQPGTLAQEKDVSGAWIFGTRRDQTPAQNGDSILLTIDKSIQFKAETILKDAVDKHQADSGSIVIMDPKTGAILAMVSYPSFNPNDYAKVDDPSVYTNLNTMGNYEPGSVFKPITMAAAINEGKISPTSTYVDTGEVQIDGYTIKNSDNKAHGTQTMSQALEESLNTGVIFAKNTIGNKKFAEYVDRFGFGQKTGIEVAEAKGDLANLKGNIGVNYHTASFGQGLSVTPLQLVRAYSALANGGKMVQPYVVQARTTPEGKVEEHKSTDPTAVITPLTASSVSAMLVNVVEKGHGKRAAVPGYYVAGKTGTAQVPRKDGKGYEPNNNIGSFAGFAPVENPRFVMLVRINHPRTVSFAESTAAPAFGQLASFLLKYFNVPPTRFDQINQ